MWAFSAPTKGRLPLPTPSLNCVLLFSVHQATLCRHVRHIRASHANIRSVRARRCSKGEDERVRGKEPWKLLRGKKKVAKADRSAESKRSIDERLIRYARDFNTVSKTTDGPVTLFPTATRQKQNFCSREGRVQFNVRLQWAWVWCRLAKGDTPVFPLVLEKCKCNSLEICSAKINAQWITQCREIVKDFESPR